MQFAPLLCVFVFYLKNRRFLDAQFAEVKLKTGVEATWKPVPQGDAGDKDFFTTEGLRGAVRAVFFFTYKFCCFKKKTKKLKKKTKKKSKK